VGATLPIALDPTVVPNETRRLSSMPRARGRHSACAVSPGSSPPARQSSTGSLPLLPVGCRKRADSPGKSTIARPSDWGAEFLAEVVHVVAVLAGFLRDLSPLQFWGEGRADGGEHLRKIGPLRSGSPYLSSAALRGCHPERSEGSRRALRATTQDQGEILRSLRSLIMTTPSTTLTHRAAIAAGRRDNAGARPAASCGAVLAQPFCPPARPFQAACNLNIGCSKCKKGGIHGAETLGPRRVLPKSPVPSPQSLVPLRS